VGFRDVDQREWIGGVDGSAVKRYVLRTPGGQRVRLDDTKQVIRLENSDGSYIEMSPEKVMLLRSVIWKLRRPGCTRCLEPRR